METDRTYREGHDTLSVTEESLTEFSIEDIFVKSLKDMKSNMFQKKYRKVLEDIQNKEPIFKTTKNFWLLRELKLCCIFKIINRKISADKAKYKTTDYWVNKIKSILEEWWEDIMLNDKIKQKDSINNSYNNSKHTNKYFNSNKNQFEVYIECVLIYIYTLAMISKGEKHTGDSAGYLSLGIRLMSEISDTCINVKTLNVAERIYFFISSILIADHDYASAFKFILTGLNFAFRELCLRLEDDELDYSLMSAYKKIQFEKLSITWYIS